MMSLTDLPLLFWGYALETTTFTLNRAPSKSVETTVGERSNFKKIPTITQDLSRRCIATRGKSVSTYPRRPKAEAFSNTVDVVGRLHDPSTERTTPPCSAHVHLDDVPRTLDLVEGRGRVSSA